MEKMKSEMRRKRQKAEPSFGQPADTGIKENAETHDVALENPMPPFGDTLLSMEGVSVAVAEERSPAAAVQTANKLELVVFKVGAEHFAFKLTHVREIVRVNELRTVPNAPEHVAGLCNLRGSILPVIDIRRRFHMPLKEYDDDSRIIVSDIDGKQAGIITDRISEVASVEASEVVEPPSHIRDHNEGYVTGIIVRNDRMIMVLDAEKIVSSSQLETAFENRKRANKDEELGNSAARADIVENLLFFHIANGFYALNLKHVKEILRYSGLTSVPNSHPYVEGVMSLRSSLLAVINPGKIFGVFDHRIHEDTRIVVIDAGTCSYGIVVDEVTEVVSVSRNQFFNPGRILNSNGLDCVNEFVKLGDDRGIAMALDPFKLISFADLSDIHLGTNEISRQTERPDDDLAKEQMNQNKIVAFKIGEEEYGVGIDCVREINNLGRIAAIPGAPDYMAGMTNLRGDIIPLMKLGTLLGMAEDNKRSLYKFLVVEHNQERIGIIVDSVSEVIGINNERLEEAPQALEAENQKKYIHQICKLNEGKRTVLLIDLPSILEFLQ